MKKILFLGAPFECYKGGSEYQYSLIETELKNKFEVYYLFRYLNETNKHNFITYNYKFRKNYSEYLYSDAVIIYKLIEKLNPDIIYKRGINYITGIGIYYAKKRRIKSVVHIASDRDTQKYTFKPNKKFLFEFINSRVQKYIIKNSARIVCQTRKQHSDLIKNFNRPGDLVLPNFHPFPDIIEKESNTINVVWVANFKKWKQPEVFIDLARNFLNTSNVKFIMVGRKGNGAWFDHILSGINECRNIEYFGELSIDETNRILSKSHIFVNTSLEYEGFPNTFIQSWLRRVPVITLNFDPDDIIKKYLLGFHSKSFEKLVADLGLLINNAKLRSKMGKLAQEYAYRKHSIGNAQELLNIFNEQ